MDSTAVEVGVKNSWNPNENILGGAKYLSKMLKKFNGNLQLTLAAYNAGPTLVEKYQSIPPIKETQLYVKKVMNFYQHYRKLHKSEESKIF
jgi:soluble lytic murein transglycosylase-like protein